MGGEREREKRRLTRASASSSWKGKNEERRGNDDNFL